MNGGELRRAIKSVSVACGNEVPLSCVSLSFDGENATAYACDRNIEIRYSFPCDHKGDPVMISPTFQVAISKTVGNEIAMKDSKTFVTVTDKGTDAVYKMPKIDAVPATLTRTDSDAEPFGIYRGHLGDFVACLKQASVSMLRKSMLAKFLYSSAELSAGPGGTFLSTTDGKRLSRVELHNSFGNSEESKLYLPAEMIEAIIKAAPKDSKDITYQIEISEQGNVILAEIIETVTKQSDTEDETRVLDVTHRTISRILTPKPVGSFPKLDKVFAVKPVASFETEQESLVELLTPAVSVTDYKDGYAGSRLEIKEGTAEVHSAGDGESHAKISIPELTGSPGSLWVNASHALEAIRSLGEDAMVTVSITDSKMLKIDCADYYQHILAACAEPVAFGGMV